MTGSSVVSGHLARIGAVLALALVATALWMVSVSPAPAREIVDMLGRKVAVPDSIERVYASAPPVGMLVYAIAPETLQGFNFNLLPGQRQDAARFLDKRTAGLPDIGSMMGHDKQADVEQVMALHPEVVIAWGSHYTDNEQLAQKFAPFNVPVVFLTLDHLSEFADAFAVVGSLFGREERGRQLGAYIMGAMARVAAAVATIPPERRVRVYYAESPDGLSTECDSSFHVEPVILAGGVGVYSCAQHELVGLERVSLEQVVSFAPDLILSQDRAFAASVTKDERWRNVKAVAGHHVLAVPKIPFNWMDRPPSFMRAIGIQWLAHELYPDAYPLDVRAETRAFYKMFLNYDLSDQDLDLILEQP